MVLLKPTPTIRRLARDALWFAGALGLMLAAACLGPRTTPVDSDPDKLADLEFQAYLADLPTVTVAEAYRAMLILADGKDPYKTFDERKTALESRGIARPAWNLAPDHVIDKGSVAYMVCRICRLRGGVNLLVFGSLGVGDRRYALRELVYRGLCEDSVHYQALTGGELVAILTKADAYMEKQGLYQAVPVELPPEPAPGETPEWTNPPPATQP